MKNMIPIFAILLFLSSCNKEETKQKNPEEKNVSSDSLDLGTLVKYDTLFISARFDECGEWGGHKEVLEVFSKKDKKLYLNYKKNTVDCDKVEEIYDAKLSLIKEIELNDEDQKAINKYMVQLLQSKIVEGPTDHSGKGFTVINSDSTLFISVYDNNYDNPIFYDSLLKKLKLK